MRRLLELNIDSPYPAISAGRQKMRAVIPFIVLSAVAGCESRDTRNAQDPTRLLLREPVLDGSRKQHDILTAAANYPDRTMSYREGKVAVRPTQRCLAGRYAERFKSLPTAAGERNR